MKRGLLLTVSSLALTLWTGCDGCNKPAPSEADGAAAPAIAADAAVGPSVKSSRDAGARRPPPPWQAVPSATAPLLPNMSIPERFEVEEKNRPANLKPNAEAAFAAFQTAGLEVVEKKQHLAQTFGARYCVGARITSGKEASAPTLVQVSVCEYASKELAESSAAYSLDMLKQIPNRAVRANKQLTLTTRGESVTPEVQAATTKATAAFDSL